MRDSPTPNQNIYLEQLRNARQSERQPDNDYDPSRPPRRSSRVALVGTIVIVVAIGLLYVFFGAMLR